MVSLIPDEMDLALRVRFGDRFAKLNKTAVPAVASSPHLTPELLSLVEPGRLKAKLQKCGPWF